ncbi:hypothetical protein MMC07_008736 [Pseudocyphellaria aurata]|nr:hypothetical protein [Pseudocyphellaria aurata]
MNPPDRRPLFRSRPSFSTRTATDDASRLDRRASVEPATSADQETPHRSDELPTDELQHWSPTHEVTKKIHDSNHRNHRPANLRDRSSSGRPKNGHASRSQISLTMQMHKYSETGGGEGTSIDPKAGSMNRPIYRSDKLGTFSGVFVPTVLNVLSILMFLRFGFILGQSGVIGIMGMSGSNCDVEVVAVEIDIWSKLGMLIVSYIINLVTTLSISAIATNGTVRGGGAYYLISRSLGPEFGGSIGIVFYLGFVFNTGMNAVGLVDCLKANFGERSGNWAQWLPQGFWVEYAWATVILVICTGICLAGSSIFARCSNALLAVLLAATFSIPLTALVLKPSQDRGSGIDYTALSAETFRGNLFPKFTQGADGSQLAGKENFQDLFGILFPATGGIFAGASMSGDLKHPSKAIPKGTLSGLALTFFAYTVVILALAGTITRESFYDNVNVIQDTNISGVVILSGEFAAAFFSTLMGVIGSAKLLQALARDNLLPGFYIFGQGTKGHDEPTYAIIVTHLVAQLTMLCDINLIASFVTMTYLMTFLVTNLACFLLSISSAPNWRPSFHYFNWWTAAFGALICGVSMFFVNGLYASGSVGILIVVFLIIHYTTPPKSWGDVSQSLIYHQVRKYLLRLRQEHVKFWRPQILLFVNDPRRQHELIQFCNSLKKGALFVLGHVIVSNDFGNAVPEARRQQAAWTKFIDVAKVKAFVNVAIAPAVEWGTRNIVLSAGLGGMRPNIVVMGAYNLDEYWDSKPLIDLPSGQTPKAHAVKASTKPPGQNGVKREQRNLKAKNMQGTLPTDICKPEGAVGIKSYVTILEDLLLGLQINVAIAKGFRELQFPRLGAEIDKKYIDLWPIQMSAEITADGGEQKRNVLTTNFDTYTLILQLGCILNTVPAWKKAYTLRVAVFVEYESDVEEERGRVKTLLDNLRIQAEILVFWLASGELKTYQTIVNGDDNTSSKITENLVDDVLKDEQWWQDLQKLRGRRGQISASEELAEVQGLLNVTPTRPTSSFQDGRRDSPVERIESPKEASQKTKRQRSSSALRGLGVRFGMRTHRLHDDMLHRHASHASASEESDSDESDLGSLEGASDMESGRASPASENDIDFKEQSGNEPSGVLSPTKTPRRHSLGGSMEIPSPTRRPLSRQSGLKVPDNGSDKRVVSETSTPDPPTAKAVSKLSRPTPIRQSSAANFSSRPVPRTTVATEDGPGPSIMFTDAASPSKSSPSQHQHRQSIYAPGDPAAAAPASGFPFPHSMPLSFNDLPCRAQHLILNELMRRHCRRHTAVLFTTLPSPVEGTCASEEDCVSYLSDLEVLCRDLPPVLLVHSNSMTVTMNL